MKAAITLSKDETSYSLLIVDPLNSANTFQKTLSLGTDYTGDIQSVIMT